MRTIIAITVAAIIALHSVLGCCWHHGHESTASGEGIDGAATAAASSSGCCSHRSVSPTPIHVAASEQLRLPSHPACCEKCDLVAKVDTERDDAETCRGAEFESALVRPILLPVVLRSHADRGRDLIAPSPVRRHLLLQLLLI